MANFSAINSIYNYYLTTYAPKSDSKFDTHKKSELRGVYNSIVKMNKEAPLYIVDKSQETKEYAVGLKENARAFHNTIASLGGVSEEDMLDKKVAYSSDESLAEAKYIGETGEEETAEAFDLSVVKLASTQLNEGRWIPSDYANIPTDTYSFDIGINGLNYEFQFNVNDGDSNKTVQERLARLITNAGIGIKAQVEEDGKGNSRLAVESVNTGTPQGNGDIFTISDDNTTRTKGTVDILGLNNVVRAASNSVFIINGMEHEASGNVFTVDKKFEVELKRVSNGEGDSTHIDLKEDIESVAANINELIKGYNDFIDTAENYSQNHPKSNRLVSEMATLASLHSDELEGLGITIQGDGHISLDEEALKKASKEGTLIEHMGALKHFAGSMLRKADQVSLNPMHYADRTIVAYKNPGHNYATPYVTSAYTGMMFNSYC